MKNIVINVMIVVGMLIVCGCGKSESENEVTTMNQSRPTKNVKKYSRENWLQLFQDAQDMLGKDAIVDVRNLLKDDDICVRGITLIVFRVVEANEAIAELRSEIEDMLSDDSQFVRTLASVVLMKKNDSAPTDLIVELKNMLRGKEDYARYSAKMALLCFGYTEDEVQRMRRER